MECIYLFPSANIACAEELRPTILFKPEPKGNLLLFLKYYFPDLARFRHLVYFIGHVGTNGSLFLDLVCGFMSTGHAIVVVCAVEQRRNSHHLVCV